MYKHTVPKTQRHAVCDPTRSYVSSDTERNGAMQLRDQKEIMSETRNRIANGMLCLRFMLKQAGARRRAVRFPSSQPLSQQLWASHCGCAASAPACCAAL